jgi:hypothetical protein
MSNEQLDFLRLSQLQQAAQAMTEREWVRSTDPFKMLPVLRENGSIRHLLDDPRSWHALGVLEAYVEGEASREELAEGALEARDASEAAKRESDGQGVLPPSAEAAEAVSLAAAPRPGAGYWSAAWQVMRATYLTAVSAKGFTGHRARHKASEAEAKALVALVHCIFNNPFRVPPPLPPEVLHWSGGRVARIAQAMYESRDFRNMPLLGNALRDAAADDEALIEHCRAGGEHARGCWAVDLVLGRY